MEGEVLREGRGKRESKKRSKDIVDATTGLFGAAYQCNT